MGNKEFKEKQEWKIWIKWREEHHFRDTETCYSCLHSKFGKFRDDKTPVFLKCELATRTIGKSFIIPSFEYVCDEWRGEEYGAVKAYGYDIASGNGA